MGESKVKVSKEKKVQEEQKYSYDELNNIAHQLNEQNIQLYKKLQEANLDNMFKRLDYLFKVLDKPEFFDNEYIDITELNSYATNTLDKLIPFITA